VSFWHVCEHYILITLLIIMLVLLLLQVLCNCKFAKQNVKGFLFKPCQIKFVSLSAETTFKSSYSLTGLNMILYDVLQMGVHN